MNYKKAYKKGMLDAIYAISFIIGWTSIIVIGIVK